MQEAFRLNDARIGQAEADAQVDLLRRDVEYDTAELTAEIMVKKLADGEVYVPAYQRPLVWPNDMKSAFIESLILALPIPYIFCSDTGDGKLEVIDGSQRLRTIDEFFKDMFPLADLQKLDLLNGFRFSDLSAVQQRKLKNRPIRTIILSEKADKTTRFDIFHRLNSYGRQLSDAQIRRGAFPGPFYTMVEECASSSEFAKLCQMKGKKDPKGEREELAVRYFAYADEYLDFRHDVAKFLNDYIVRMNVSSPAIIQGKREAFETMLTFVDENFPYGFRRTQRSAEVPRVRFEAIAVGSHFAIIGGAQPPFDFSWLEGDEFKDLIRTDASNSTKKLRSRIEFVRDNLLRVP